MPEFFSNDMQRVEPSEFLCGVVEGFYGRPWTYSQRRELFRRMQSMGMNSYLYAPKDDSKHRLSWRELYAGKEAENMRSLISAANDHEICFIFAISPGTDIVYSDEADIEALKARLHQAMNLGCRAFALLFDDIEARLSPADREVYGSPGRAQSTITNKVYEALDRPEIFLFCPTEYCASRAVPNVNHSSYLATLGNELAQGIQVMWTGPLVVSKRIPTLGIRELGRLLKRRIVLWDNLHANDYDQRRVFLGPYAGRPLALRRRRLLHGVLTNPNCEFEANYVALHTLAQWARVGHPPRAKVSAGLSSAEGGERVEDGDDTSGDDTSSSASASPPLYRPREALHHALKDWLALMLQDQRSNSALAKQSLPHSESPIPMETDGTDAQEIPMQTECDEGPTCGKPGSDVNMGSESINGEVSSLGISVEDLELLADLFYLPFTHGPTALRALELGHWLRENAHLASVDKSTEDNRWSNKFDELIKIIDNVSQLREKIQRLPHPGVVYDLAPYLTDITSIFAMLLDYFRWLQNGVMANRTQAHLKRILSWFSPGYSEMTMSGEHEPWMFRGGLITELQRILPLESAQDLFPAPSRVGPTMTTTLAGPAASAPLPCHEADDFAQSTVLPLGVLMDNLAEQPLRPYVLRPYRSEDKVRVYALWRRILLHRLGLPQGALPTKYADLPGDRYLLVYLERFPQHCLVAEGPPLCFDQAANRTTSTTTTSPITATSTAGSRLQSQWDIVAFGFAAPDVVTLTRERDDLRRGPLRAKYPKVAPSPSATDNEASAATPSIPRKPSITSNTLPKLSMENFIRLSLDWIHDERVTRATSSVLAEAAINEVPPPEPLGTAILEQRQLQSHQHLHQQQPMAVEPCEFRAKSEDQPASSGVEAEYAESDEASLVNEKSNGEGRRDVKHKKSVLEDEEQARSSARSVEAIHSAMVTHPASIFVELDDCFFPRSPSQTAATPVNSDNVSAATPNHNRFHPGAGLDPSELVLDEVARRLFVCLLAGLKTCASHGVHVELDTINETRADFYLRFGFYPVTAASTEFVTVLGRLI